MSKVYGPERSRSEQARKIARGVSERIREAITEGLAHWPPTWELVAGPSDSFMDRLYEWEGSGLPADREAVQRAAEALVDTWRVADTKFQVSRLADVKVPA